jgi:hypothetical protein
MRGEDSFGDTSQKDKSKAPLEFGVSLPSA